MYSPSDHSWLSKPLPIHFPVEELAVAFRSRPISVLITMSQTIVEALLLFSLMPPLLLLLLLLLCACLLLACFLLCPVPTIVMCVFAVLRFGLWLLL